MNDLEAIECIDPSCTAKADVGINHVACCAQHVGLALDQIFGPIRRAMRRLQEANDPEAGAE